ncbi:MAG: hypothetical protein QOE47_2815 [Pyrinomonadaceae bacterium]|nr:hypothetical protein [Pyrinomonadaceae bacterium]
MPVKNRRANFIFRVLCVDDCRRSGDRDGRGTILGTILKRVTRK